jgi:ATP-dependent DNA helicase PIF1
MELTTKQQSFIDMALSGENLFLTGKAGTGKSFVVKQTINALREAGKRVAAIAPTGIAANNVGGQTIHSLFKLPVHGIIDFKAVAYAKGGTREVLKNTDTWIIDEVSMLRPDVLDGMHYTLIKNGLPGLDKRQLIFVGDLKQLPVVLTDNDRSMLLRIYDGETFHYAKIFKKVEIHTVELTEVLRQSNEEFINALNIIREGGKSDYFRQFVSTEASGIILAPHNSTVAGYNQEGLNKQKGEEFTFIASITGTAKPQDFHLEEEVKVKNGCKIMYLINSQDNPLRNGTLGVFTSYNDCHYIRVGGVDYALQKVTLCKKMYVYDEHKDELVLKEVGSIEQYPIKLAYALSIHKSQGLTFDEVTLDLRKPCFQKGQMYVGLSRVKTPEGLRIIL